MRNNKIPTRVSFKCKIASESLLETLAVKVLGAKNLLKDPGLIVYQLPDDTVLEIHGTTSYHSQKHCAGGDVVLSFQVENIDESVKQMLVAGAMSVDGIIRISKTYAYCHLSLNDGQIVGLHQID